LQFHIEGQIANAPPLATTLAGLAIAEEPLKVATAATPAGTGSGVTIAGFPTVSSTATKIVLDAGFACSVEAQTENVSPAVTAFNLTITVPGKAAVEVRIIIVRPPVLGMGAFTIPALPIAVVYAPPQGKQNKNFASYTVADIFTRSLTTAITSSTSTKTAQAFSAGDIIGKVAGAIASVAAIVGTGGTAGASAGVLGALLTTLTGTGGSSSTRSTVSNDLKTASSALDLLGDAVSSVGSVGETQGGTVTAESDHSITVQITDMSAYTTEIGAGPGAGDIFVYFSDVKVVWTAINGDVGIHVLGFGAIATQTASALLQEQQSLSQGGAPTLGLDAASIESLLNLDPFCVKRPVGALSGLLLPLVSPPRFTPAATPERSGAGTGGVWTEIVDVTNEDKEVQTTTQTTITDAKPGWLSVLFGGDDTETTTTMTLTTAQTTDIKTELKVTNVVNIFSEDSTDPFDIMFFIDRSFGTYLYAENGSSVLQGGRGIVPGLGQFAARTGG
jgi:hypothetical protein